MSAGVMHPYRSPEAPSQDPAAWRLHDYSVDARRAERRERIERVVKWAWGILYGCLLLTDVLVGGSARLCYTATRVGAIALSIVITVVGSRVMAYREARSPCAFKAKLARETEEFLAREEARRQCSSW